MLARYSLLFGLTFFSSNVFAQVSLNSGGSNPTSGSSLSFTIGQISYIQFQGSSLSVQEGVQQSWPVDSGIHLPETLFKNQFSLYPNPSTHYLLLSFTNPKVYPLGYTIVNGQGHLVQKGIVESNTSTISIKALASGLYFLLIEDQNLNLKPLKFIKE